jgi:PD-(D/E)XK nuclease superfamily
MNLKVSHSRLERFKQCSESYRLYYEENLCGIKIASPLFFGSAIDAAVELFLLKKKVELTERELSLMLNETAYSMFDKTMREQNGQLLERNILCDYFASDFEPSILKIEDLALLKTQYPYCLDFFGFWENINLSIQAKKHIQDSERILFNHLNWLSLYRKGEMLLKAYEIEILPKIHTVFEIQKDTKLVNAAGDELHGKIDFIASFTDAPNLKYIIDLKTSSKPYPEDAVESSTQLVIYSQAEDIPNASYAVLEKKIRIKEPRVRTQLLRGDFTQDHVDAVFDIIDSSVHKIAAREFYKKESPRLCHFYGKRCEFYDLCWHNDYSKVKKR